RAHDRAESNRIRNALLAYVAASTREFNRAAASGDTLAQQRRIDRELSRFESLINIEMQRLAHATRVANPKARLALVIAAVAAALLVGSLIWQFELQRR